MTINYKRHGVTMRMTGEKIFYKIKNMADE
jgi:hypothetical protein